VFLKQNTGGNPPPAENGNGELESESLPPVYPEEMAFPRAHDD
jgi:hypothetical protein